MPIYLDNAATSFPKPEEVYRAVDRCLREQGAAFGRGTHSQADGVRNLVDDARRAVARLIDAYSHQHVVFTLNCTDSLNIALQGLLRPGDRVITTTLEHNSVLRPLNHLADQYDVDVTTIGFDPVSGIIDLEQFESELKNRPAKLAAFTHASNVTGVVQPVKELTRLAHQYGALVLLDAAQTTGHLPFSMSDLNVDLLAAAGHKGLLGPLGTGILALRPGLEQQISPFRFGGTGTNSESPKQPDAMPQRFESGNLNVPGLAGLLAGVEWLERQTIEQIARQSEMLTEHLFEGLSQCDEVRFLSPESARPQAGIVSFVIDGMDSRDVGMILDQSFEIACRTGMHCAPLVHTALNAESSGGSVRLSPGPFNTLEEVRSAIEAVSTIAASGT